MADIKSFDDVKENKFYLYKNKNNVCFFKTYLDKDLVYANDIFVKTSGEFDECFNNWQPCNVYSSTDLEFIKEIDLNTNPEYFL